jgi:hypothetical protein
MNTTQTITATSTYGTVREVTIDSRGLVFTGSVLMGERGCMENLGWEFSA